MQPVRAVVREIELPIPSPVSQSSPPASTPARRAAAALACGDLRGAELEARSLLRNNPQDVAGLLILADVAAGVGIYHEAEAQLRRVLSLAPEHVEARVSLALAIVQQRRTDEGLALLDNVIANNPGHVRAAATRANILAQLGDYEAAAATYEALLVTTSGHPEVWTWYGNLLKTVGRQEGSVTAYRRALALNPDLAEAWWSLAELKAGRIEDDDIDMMLQLLSREPTDVDATFLHFALGQAYEDREKWEPSFRHYAAGNRLRLAREPHDRRLVSNEVDRAINTYNRAFFDARRDWGAASPAPIFILGLPRAGSTLIEQILASHGEVEGTSELPYIPQLVQALVAERWRDRAAAHPEIVHAITPASAAALGNRYLDSAARHRKTERPFFIDKLPNNWLYAGFIGLILPHARIIDARRDPMACCFSNFKQHFARGQTFAYSLEDIGAYYRDYVRFMAHLDQTRPGRVYRVDHEALLANPEGEIRRLLVALDLPFDDRCLKPHENRRPVRTASSEQVRRPISARAVDQWRHFEPWLGPLKTALGPLAG